MPQLDMLSWLGQIFNTLIVFFSFYLLLSLIFLPSITVISKGRYKLEIFRKIIVRLLHMQYKLLIKDTRKNLLFFSLTNIFLINSFYQPMFSNKVINTLSKIFYDITLSSNSSLAMKDINDITIMTQDLNDFDFVDVILNLLVNKSQVNSLKSSLILQKINL